MWITSIVIIVGHILITGRFEQYKLKPKKNAILQQETLSELDSSMNRWLTDLPENSMFLKISLNPPTDINTVRWDPNHPTREAAYTYSIFYTVQIFVHRPYIPTSKSKSQLSFPSLLIATSAARAIAKIVSSPEIQNFGSKVPISIIQVCTPTPHLQPYNRRLWPKQLASLSAGMILLLSTWSGKRSGLLFATGPDIGHVHECMKFLKNCEERWNTAAHHW